MDLMEAIGELWAIRDQLSDWERDFIGDNLTRNDFSEKQRDVVLDMYFRRVENRTPEPVELEDPITMQHDQWAKSVRDQIGEHIIDDWEWHEPNTNQFFHEGSANQKRWTVCSKKDPALGFVLTIDGKNGQRKFVFHSNRTHTHHLMELQDEGKQVPVDFRMVLFRGVMGWKADAAWARCGEKEGLRRLVKAVIESVARCQRLYLKERPAGA